MRIAFSGCANSGKTTLVNAFKAKWPMFSYPTKTYRDVLKENNLEHSAKTSAETQLHILNWMMEEQENYPTGSKVVYDRCPWDNLAYTLQANADGIVSDEVAAATISFVKESMKNLDIIFWIPFHDQIKIVDDGTREAKEHYIRETDKIFEDLFSHYSDNLEEDVFYPKEDCPAIIKMEYLTVDDRLFYVSQFIDQNGDLIVEESSILDPENVDTLEKMLKEQADTILSEDQIKALTNSIRDTKR